MSEAEKKARDEEARRFALAFGGTGVSNAANNCAAGNGVLQPHASVQGATHQDRPRKEEMALPVLEEMGDIGPALATLLRLQAEYARGEPGVSRAMRDVAHSALAVEIERYTLNRSRYVPRADTIKECVTALKDLADYAAKNWTDDEHDGVLLAISELERLKDAAPQVPATARSGERLDTTTPAEAASESRISRESSK